MLFLDTISDALLRTTKKLMSRYTDTIPPVNGI